MKGVLISSCWGLGCWEWGVVPQKDEEVKARGDFSRGQIYLFIYSYYTQEVDSFKTVNTFCHFCFSPQFVMILT